MEVMSKEICDRISDRIRLREIFKNPEESINLIDQAHNVVNKWKTSYNDTKNKTKWDYVNTNITGGTEYISKIVQKLKLGLIKIKDFLKFLGPELKRVIGGSSEKIEKEREKIYQAYSHIEFYPHNIFSKVNEESCNNAFAAFDVAMKGLENDTIRLIDETFRDLRSAESAYDLYTNFENLIKQPEIKEAMNKKYINILTQFTKEIKEYSANFETNKDNPPISKAKSEVAGKIAWARLIYLKMRRPLSKIFNKQKSKNNNTISDENKELEKHEKELTDSFFEIGRKLKDYETKIYDNWKKECESKFMIYLRNNILMK
jgi:dynein heavy chain